MNWTIYRILVPLQHAFSRKNKIKKSKWLKIDYATVYWKVFAKHKMPHIKKGFSSIKTGFVLMLHAQKKLVNKKGFNCIKKVFPNKS
jgi:hypothetical protein